MRPLQSVLSPGPLSSKAASLCFCSPRLLMPLLESHINGSHCMCLFSFTQHNVFEIYPHRCMLSIVHLFLWPNCILLNECTIICFIYSPVDRCSVCVQIWAILNKAAVNTLVQVLCEHKFSFLFGNSKECNC